MIWSRRIGIARAELALQSQPQPSQQQQRRRLVELRCVVSFSSNLLDTLDELRVQLHSHSQILAS